MANQYFRRDGVNITATQFSLIALIASLFRVVGRIVRKINHGRHIEASNDITHFIERIKVEHKYIIASVNNHHAKETPNDQQTD